MSGQPVEMLTGEAAETELRAAAELIRSKAAEDPFSLPAIIADGKVQEYWPRLALGIAQKNTQTVRDAVTNAHSFREVKVLRGLLEQAETIEKRVRDRVQVYHQQAKSVDELKKAMEILQGLGT